MSKVLFIGDIVGRPGRSAVIARVREWREQYGASYIIANAENAAGGAGLTASIAISLHEAGVDGITLGDHVWDQKSFAAEIDTLPFVCRPLNLPPEAPGRDHLHLVGKGFTLTVFTVLGRQFMPAQDCPFRGADAFLARPGIADGVILAEIHAEATSEKIAFGRYLDGRVGGVVGTHTHVPTADAAIMPKGTAYQTDVGMTGAYDSVLGREVDPVVKRFLSGMPQKFGVASGDVRLGGALIEICPETKRAKSICSLFLPLA